MLVTCGPHPLAPSPVPTAPSSLSSPRRGLAESGSGVAWDESHHCGLLARVVPEHFQTCRRNLEVMHSVVRAAAETVSACQKTFEGMRWNCSSIQRAPSFGPDLLKGKGGSPREARNKTSLLPLWDARFPSLSGTRESAFVHALAAAAVAHAIARACASGSLPLCSCGSAPSEVPGPDFRWGGCGDNLRYGLQLGAAFADSPVKSSGPGRTALRAVNLHNGAVGRQVGVRRDPTACCRGAEPRGDTPGSPGGAVLRVRRHPRG